MRYVHTLGISISVKKYPWSNIKLYKAVNKQYFYLFQDIINDNSDFNLFFNMSAQTAILDSANTLLMSKFVRQCYLHCNEHNNVPIPTPPNTIQV